MSFGRGGGRGRGGGFKPRGGSGGNFGGGGRNRFETGPPERVIPLGYFDYVCQDDLVCKVTIEDVPYFNAPIFLENKEQVGKIDEIFGNLRDFYVSVKVSDNVKASSFKSQQKLFIDPGKLLPLHRFLPKAPQPKGPKKKGAPGGGGGRGGFKPGGANRGGGGFGRGGGGFKPGGANRGGGFGRGGGGFRGGGSRGAGGGRGGGRGSFGGGGGSKW